MMLILSKIWSFITTGIMPKVLEYGGIVAGLIGTWAMIKKSGETAVELKEESNTLQGVKDKNEIQNNNSNSDAIGELRSKWKR